MRKMGVNQVRNQVKDQAKKPIEKRGMYPTKNLGLYPTRESIARFLIAVMLCSALLAGAVTAVSAAPAVPGKDKRPVLPTAEELPNGTLIIGLHLIDIRAVTTDLHEKALATVQDSGQKKIYYKSEFAAGAWVDITNSTDLLAITAASDKVATNAEIMQILTKMLYWTKSDGETIELVTGESVVLANLNDFNDVTLLLELEDVLLQRDALEAIRTQMIAQGLLQAHGQERVTVGMTAEERAQAEVLRQKQESIAAVLQPLSGLDREKEPQYFLEARKLTENIEVVAAAIQQLIADKTETEIIELLEAVIQDFETQRTVLICQQMLDRLSRETAVATKQEFADLIEVYGKATDKFNKQIMELATGAAASSDGSLLSAALAERVDNLVAALLHGGEQSRMEDLLRAVRNLTDIKANNIRDVKGELVVLRPVSEKARGAFLRACAAAQTSEYMAAVSAKEPDAALGAMIEGRVTALRLMGEEAETLVSLMAERTVDVERRIKLYADLRNGVRDQAATLPENDHRMKTNEMMQAFVNRLSGNVAALMAEDIENQNPDAMLLARLSSEAETLLNVKYLEALTAGDRGLAADIKVQLDELNNRIMALQDGALTAYIALLRERKTLQAEMDTALKGLAGQGKGQEDAGQTAESAIEQTAETTAETTAESATEQIAETTAEAATGQTTEKTTEAMIETTAETTTETGKDIAGIQTRLDTVNAKLIAYRKTLGDEIAKAIDAYLTRSDELLAAIAGRNYKLANELAADIKSIISILPESLLGPDGILDLQGKLDRLYVTTVVGLDIIGAEAIQRVVHAIFGEREIPDLLLLMELAQEDELTEEKRAEINALLDSVKAGIEKGVVDKKSLAALKEIQKQAGADTALSAGDLTEEETYDGVIVEIEANSALDYLRRVELKLGSPYSDNVNRMTGAIELRRAYSAKLMILRLMRESGKFVPQAVELDDLISHYVRENKKYEATKYQTPVLTQIRLKQEEILGKNPTMKALEPESTVVGNVVVLLNSPAVIRSGKVLFPIRDFYRAFDYVIEWEPVYHVTTVKDGNGTDWQYYMGSNQAIRGTESLTLAAPALLLGNRAYAPLEDMARTVDMELYWFSADNFGIVYPNSRIQLIQRAISGLVAVQ